MVLLKKESRSRCVDGSSEAVNLLQGLFYDPRSSRVSVWCLQEDLADSVS